MAFVDHSRPAEEYIQAVGLEHLTEAEIIALQKRFRGKRDVYIYCEQHRT